MPGVPSFPQTGLPTMTAEGTLQRRNQLFYSSPFAPGAYIIRGGTFKNTTGAVLASGVPEGTLLSFDATLNLYVPWVTTQDGSGEVQMAAGVARDGHGGSLALNATVLITVILAARGGLRVPALYYNAAGTAATFTACDGTQRDNFIADYIAAGKSVV